MPDAPISSTSLELDARGRDNPSPVTQLDRHALNGVVHGPDRDARVKRHRPLSDDEIREIADRLSRSNSQPEGDLALFYPMLTTGAKPLELARLVRDNHLGR